MGALGTSNKYQACGHSRKSNVMTCLRHVISNSIMDTTVVVYFFIDSVRKLLDSSSYFLSYVTICRQDPFS
jgi:hypothetical protein